MIHFSSRSTDLQLSPYRSPSDGICRGLSDKGTQPDAGELGEVSWNREDTSTCSAWDSRAHGSAGSPLLQSTALTPQPDSAVHNPQPIISKPGSLIHVSPTGVLAEFPADLSQHECAEGGGLLSRFGDYPNAVTEDPGTGEVRPLGEKVLDQMLNKINDPATPFEEAYSLWKNYRKDAQAYLRLPASYDSQFKDFSYTTTNHPGLQVVGFPTPARLRGSMVEWCNYIQEKNPDGTITLTPLQPEEGMEEGPFGIAEEGTFYLAHYKAGRVETVYLDTPGPQTLLTLAYDAQASSLLTASGEHQYVKVGQRWLKLNNEG